MPGSTRTRLSGSSSPKAKPVYKTSAYVRTRYKSVTVISAAVASSTHNPATAKAGRSRRNVTCHRTCSDVPSNNASSSSDDWMCRAAAATSNITQGVAAIA
jgi:hypothetical protein